MQTYFEEKLYFQNPERQVRNSRSIQCYTSTQHFKRKKSQPQKEQTNIIYDIYFFIRLGNRKLQNANTTLFKK